MYYGNYIFTYKDAIYILKNIYSVLCLIKSNVYYFNQKIFFNLSFIQVIIIIIIYFFDPGLKILDQTKKF